MDLTPDELAKYARITKNTQTFLKTKPPSMEYFLMDANMRARNGMIGMYTPDEELAEERDAQERNLQKQMNFEVVRRTVGGMDLSSLGATRPKDMDNDEEYQSWYLAQRMQQRREAVESYEGTREEKLKEAASKEQVQLLLAERDIH